MNDDTMHGFNTVVKLFFCCSQVHEELANHSSNLLLFFIVFFANVADMFFQFTPLQYGDVIS